MHRLGLGHNGISFSLGSSSGVGFMNWDYKPFKYKAKFLPIFYFLRVIRSVVGYGQRYQSICLFLSLEKRFDRSKNSHKTNQFHSISKQYGGDKEPIKCRTPVEPKNRPTSTTASKAIHQHTTSKSKQIRFRLDAVNEWTGFGYGWRHPASSSQSWCRTATKNADTRQPVRWTSNGNEVAQRKNVKQTISL